MLYWKKELTPDNLPLRYGWEAFVFGAMFGTINYLAGQVTMNTSSYIMLMLGLTNHSEDSEDNKTINSNTVGPNGQSQSTTINTHDSNSKATDFKDLLKLQQEWFFFYSLIKSTQLISPYLFVLLVEFAVSCIYGLAFLFM